MSRLGRSQLLGATTAQQAKRSAPATLVESHRHPSANNQLSSGGSCAPINNLAKRTRHTTAATAAASSADTTVTLVENDEAIENNMTDTATAAANTQKRANFSALAVANPNGVSKISPSLAISKPGSARKLVIKNFKSKH